MQKREVVLFETVYNQIVHLLEENPTIEVVGLCFGIYDKNRVKIRSFVQMVNLDNSATSFSLDYEVLYREIQHHEKKKENFVGIFHSHPQGAKLYPSQKDLYFMHYWPYPYLWVIGSSREEGTGSQVAIFSLLDKKIVEIPYLIMNV
ncbi:MAG: Mov34/MPN/PAD-1 family protein [Candidatus Hodarchaeota archaeon]